MNCYTHKKKMTVMLKCILAVIVVIQLQLYFPVIDTHMSSQTTYKYVATGKLFSKVLFGSLMSENLNNNYMMFHLKVSTMHVTASAV